MGCKSIPSKAAALLLSSPPPPSLETSSNFARRLGGGGRREVFRVEVGGFHARARSHRRGGGVGGGREKGLRGSRFYEHLVFVHTAIFDDAGGPDDLMNEI